MPKQIAVYIPQSNGRAERMVQSMKAAMKRMTVESPTEWNEELWIIEHLYPEWKMNDGFSSYYVMFEVASRRPAIKGVPTVSDSLNTEPTLPSIRARFVALLAVEAH